MEKDCLIIGHNEVKFSEYISRQQQNNAVYYELSYSFLYNDGVPITLQDIYNKFISFDKIEKYGKFDSSSLFNTAVAYLGTYLSKRDIIFDYINSFHSERLKLELLLFNNKYKSIVITTTFHYFAFPIQEIVAFIKKYSPSSKIIIGGPYIYGNMFLSEEVKKEIIHKALGGDIYIISPQGEDTLFEVINAIKFNRNYKTINNISYKEGSQIINNPISHNYIKLDENMIDWDLFRNDIKYYMTVRTALSCPLSCAFCTYPTWSGNNYSYVGVDSIKYELDKLEKSGKVKTVYFTDDTFNVPIDRFKEILKMMIKENYSFTWHSYIRCQYLDDEALELMKKSKCTGVMLGVETADNKLLKMMNKNATIEEYREAIIKLKKNNIQTMVYLLIGFPGETKETFEKTILFLKEIKPDFYRPFIWLASPGTPIMQEKEKYKIEGTNYDWKHYTLNIEDAKKMYNQLFYEIKDSVWCPHYYFDYTGVAHLLERGMTQEEIKKFINLYNEEIKYQKLTNSKNLRNEYIGKVLEILNKEKINEKNK